MSFVEVIDNCTSGVHVVLCSVIGKGGEQIASIQSETECRIQFAPGLCSCFLMLL